MRQVEAVDQHETLLIVVLQFGVQPFKRLRDAFEQLQIRFERQRVAILGGRKWSLGVVCAR